MIWDPLFSPDSKRVALRAREKGRFFVVLDGKPGKQTFDILWDPVFSPDGEKILIRGIDDGRYYRRVVRVSEI
jgi:hypothetical protein